MKLLSNKEADLEALQRQIKVTKFKEIEVWCINMCKLIDSILGGKKGVHARVLETASAGEANESKK